MIKRIFTFLTAVCALCTFCNISVQGETAEIGEDFRGVWVSSVMNLDFPSKPGLSNEEMIEEIDLIVDRASDIGLNAIVLQVRPTADALYESEIFPWSGYLTGVQGLAPADGFDPLAYWIDRAHENGLELHAWINPYRITHTTAKITDTSALAATHPARQNPGWVIAYKDALYFDPGLPECKELIIDGIAEIVENYDVDGIHLDDYFYPGIDFLDGATYAKYGGGLELGDWRRENVNDVVKGIQEAVKEIAPEVRFGISPAAIWKNVSSDPLGSDTKGYETYKSAYADTRRWVKEGWLDYICPQIYWYIGFEVADYQKVLNWWEDVCRGTSVDLYVGHAAYREDAQTDKWQGEIIRQLQLNDKSDTVKGSIFFRASNLWGGVGEQIKAFFE